MIEYTPFIEWDPYVQVLVIGLGLLVCVTVYALRDVIFSRKK